MSSRENQLMISNHPPAIPPKITLHHSKPGRESKVYQNVSKHYIFPTIEPVFKTLT